jgi:hypothetical protein
MCAVCSSWQLCLWCAKVIYVLELYCCIRTHLLNKLFFPQEHVRDIKWTIDSPHNFMQKCGKEPIKAVIEHVRDGSTVRAFLLPDFYHITLMLSGIRVSAVFSCSQCLALNMKFLQQ